MKTRKRTQGFLTFAAVGLVLAGYVPCANAVVIATWTSPTIDNGDLEGAAVNLATGVVDSVQGAGLFAAGGSPDLTDSADGNPPSAIPGGEITYATISAIGVDDDTTTAADAINDLQYFQFSFTVSASTLDIDSFTYTSRRNANVAANGWDDSQLAFRVNDTSFTSADLIGSVNNDPDNGDLDTFTVNTGLPTGLSNGDVVNFRLYAWGSDGSDVGGAVLFQAGSRLGDISIQGTGLPNTPEPGTFVLAALGALGMTCLGPATAAAIVVSSEQAIT